MAAEKAGLTGTVIALLGEKKFQSVRDILLTMQPVDIAAVLAELSAQDILVLIRLLPKDAAAETFVEMTAEQQEDLRRTIQAEPRRFISQEVIDFQDLPLMEGEEQVDRKADLRAFVLSGETVQVWPSGLTRFSRNPDSFIVNSSQGGGFKDTWVLSQ